MKKLVEILLVSALFIVLLASVSFAKTGEVKKFDLEIKKSAKLRVNERCKSVSYRKGTRKLEEEESELSDPCAILRAAAKEAGDQAREDDRDATLSTAFKASSLKAKENAEASLLKCEEEHSKAGRKFNMLKEFIHEITQPFKVNININKTKTSSRIEDTTRDYGPISDDSSGDDFWGD